jgi:hypothetical protein
MKGTCCHDPITVLEAIYPTKFCSYIETDSIIHLTDKVSVVIDNNGKHKIGVQGDGKFFLDFFSNVINSICDLLI